MFFLFFLKRKSLCLSFEEREKLITIQPQTVSGKEEGNYWTILRVIILVFVSDCRRHPDTRSDPLYNSENIKIC